MNKNDYLEIQENYSVYKKYYIMLYAMIIFIILLPIIIYIIEMAFSITIVNDMILIFSYLISFGTIVFMRTYFRRNRFVRKLIYFNSFKHMVEHELTDVEVENIVKKYEELYQAHVIEMDHYLKLQINQMTVNIFRENITLETVQNCTQKVDHIVVNVFIAKTLNEAVHDAILYDMPKKTNKLLLNIGFEQATNHVFFCANDLYKFNIKDKKLVNQVLNSLFTK